MDLKVLTDDQKDEYNSIVTHVVQSWEWGEFRKSLGTPLLRYGLYNHNNIVSAFQLTLHQVPLLKNKFVGYLPKGPFPDTNLTEALIRIGTENNCIAIKIEPNIQIQSFEAKNQKIDPRFRISNKPLFTKYNYILDLERKEDEILKNMHPKFRYNIKIAQRHHIKVEQRKDMEAFEIYAKLYFETTQRQQYHGHNYEYHKKVWQIMQKSGMARILIAFYTPPETKQAIPLTAWMLFNFKDTLYYPYGGSSDQYRNVMSSNLVAWEAIKLGQRLKLKKFDLWGTLSPDSNPNHPWQGFTRFKTGMGPELVENIGTFDLVFEPLLYQTFNQIDKLTPLKVFLLKLLKK